MGGQPSSSPASLRRRIGVIVAVAVVVAAGLVVVLGRALAPAHLPGAVPQGITAPGASSEGYSVWERNDDGFPVRWDPCEPIVVVHNLDAGPVDVVADLEAAVATLRDVTGLDLVVAGAADEPPRSDRAPYQPDRYGERWAPVLVTWADPDHAELPLRDIDRGVGMPVAVGPAGDRTYVTGQVVLNADRHDLDPGRSDRATSWGATLLHELAHVLGLGHVDDPDQLMHVHPGEGPVELGEGDVTGLQAVGAEGGCRPAPDPQPVDLQDVSSSPDP